MAQFQITEFSDATPSFLPSIRYGTDWPVVYILNDSTEAYVGETLDMTVRASQHLANEARRHLTQITLISNDDYNKSVILDLEAFLIKHMAVDKKFTLQNGNMGLHLHNYYNRAYYEEQFKNIWEEMRKHNLAGNNLATIENSDEFKYSPYNSLSTDQYVAVANIIQALANAVETHRPLTAVVQGNPGTGKTVLAVYLMKLIKGFSMELSESQMLDPEDDEVIAALPTNLAKLPGQYRVGLVIPQQALRVTLKNVFKSTAQLSEDMILSPKDIVHAVDFDLLLVDEAHRLRRRKGLSQYPSFDDANSLLGLGPDGTELDWIRKKTKNLVLFYDPLQSVRPSDIRQTDIEALKQTENYRSFQLHTQFRCNGGYDYVQYVRAILSGNPPEKAKSFEGYDVQLFTDCGRMTDKIHEMDNQFGLSRTVAGYAWKWVSKSNRDRYDIFLDGRMYRWNQTYTDWINTFGSVNEIGCIHTVQGYDLNYCAVIFGWEIDYDPDVEKIIVHKNRYYDNLAKAVDGDEALLTKQICNVYSTLLTRGIRGTYLYACNPNMREYLARYFPIES